jgi:hypothetical protein
MILTAGVFVAETIATPIGGFLSDVAHPWIPYLTTPIMLGMGGLLIWALPETLPPRDARSEVNDEDHDTSLLKHLQSLRIRPLLSRLTQHIRTAPRTLWRNLTLACLIAVYFASFLSRQSTNFIVLYASKKFSWSLARVRRPSSIPSLTKLAMSRPAISSPCGPEHNSSLCSSYSHCSAASS